MTAYSDFQNSITSAHSLIAMYKELRRRRGLGLAITRKLARLMGGAMSAREIALIMFAALLVTAIAACVGA
jgi:hypothetical protein